MSDAGRRGLFTGRFLLCTASCFFLTLVFFIFYTGMPAFATNVLGTDETMAGIIAGIFIAGDVLARLLAGSRMRSVGARRIALSSLVLCIAMSSLYLVADTVPMVCVIGFLQGAAYGAAETAIYTMVIDGLPLDRRGEGLGYFMLNYSLASAIGPFISISLQNEGSYDMILVAGVIVSVLSAVMVMFVGKDRIEPVPHKHGNGFRMSDYFERGALKMSLIMFLFFMSYSGVLTFIAPYGAEKGLEWYASVFFVVMSVSTLICRMFLGKMYDRKGINRALVPFLLAYIAGMVMLGTVSSGPVMLLSAFMIGTMVAMLNMVSQAAVVHDVDASRYGVAVSTLNTFMDLSYMVGPVVNGVMIGYAGYSGNYLAMAVIAMFSFVLYLVLVGIPYHRSHGKGRVCGDVPYGKP